MSWGSFYIIWTEWQFLGKHKCNCDSFYFSLASNNFVFKLQKMMALNLIWSRSARPTEWLRPRGDPSLMEFTRTLLTRDCLSTHHTEAAHNSLLSTGTWAVTALCLGLVVKNTRAFLLQQSPPLHVRQFLLLSLQCCNQISRCV